jgi:hypothetical protein
MSEWMESIADLMRTMTIVAFRSGLAAEELEPSDTGDLGASSD